MARLTSTPTTVAVVSTATPLFQAAAKTASNTFVEFSGGGLLVRSAHPVTRNLVNVLEDGRLSQGYQTLGYSGKGSYDPVSRQVLWASTGAGSNYNGGYVHNTQARYVEAANTWTANRAFKGEGDPTSKNGLVHIYDSNCVDVPGRRAYKKWFSNEILVYDIDANRFLANIAGPSGHSSSYTWDAMDVIPGRGRAGALWLFGWSSSNTIQVWEYDLATGAWSVLVSATEFGNQGSPSLGAPVLSYNPRAFNGAGGVMLGNESSVWTINCSTLARSTVATPPGGSIQVAYRGHNSGFCRDPSGPGWLHFSEEARAVFKWTNSNWEARAALPEVLRGSTQNFIVVPVDPYGVVWVISYDAGAGWLYRP